jgi:hypothetical protein
MPQRSTSWRPRFAAGVLVPYRSWLVFGLLGCFGAGLVPGPARGADTFAELMKRIPSEGNAVALININALLDSPLGKREKWRDRVADRPTGVLGVSLNAAKVAVVASVDYNTLSDRWKIGMVETKGAPPSLSTLATREGGFVEQIETQNAAWTPRGLYLFRFDPNIIGFTAPADRQFLAQWIKNTLIKPRTSPESWYDRAVFRANAGTPIVVAIDLAHAISPVQAEAWVTSIDAVKKYRLDPKVLGPKLAGATSAVFQIDVDETIKGTLRIEFDGDISYAAPAAKELILTALDGMGAHVEDFAKWGASAKDRAITLSGRLDEDDAARITRLLSIPHLNGLEDRYASQPEPAPGAQAAAAAPATEGDVVKASQQYFRAVVDLVNKIKGQRNQSYNSIRLWMDRTASELDELPILNVDNDLLDWGSKMSYSLREMAFNVNYTSKNRTYQKANSGYYDGYGGYYNGYDDRQAKSASNSVLNVDLDGRWKAIQTSIGEMRKALVAKYKVDF